MDAAGALRSWASTRAKFSNSSCCCLIFCCKAIFCSAFPMMWLTAAAFMRDFEIAHECGGSQPHHRKCTAEDRLATEDQAATGRVGEFRSRAGPRPEST